MQYDAFCGFVASLQLTLSPRIHSSARYPISPCPTKKVRIGRTKSSRSCTVVCNAASDRVLGVVSENSLDTPQSPQNWENRIRPGSVLEVWNCAELRFAYVVSLYEKGVVAVFLQISDTVTIDECQTKVSFGEIISVWPDHLIPHETGASNLVTAVSAGFSILSRSSPRALDAVSVYNLMRNSSNANAQSTLTSFQISEILFPPRSDHSAQRRAAFAAATGLLIASDTIRFKRADPGRGWRALPPSVTISRGRCSFVDACAAILDERRSSSEKNNSAAQSSRIVWSRDQLDILRDLEIVAASGCAANGTAAVTLQQLGYAPTDDGAATLLLDINYWTTGITSNLASRDTVRKYAGDSHFFSEVADNTIEHDSGVDTGNDVYSTRHNETKEWTFSREILAEARDIRSTTRARKRAYMTAKRAPFGKRRRSLLHPPEGQSILRTYCIDEKSSRFLDDAISVRVIANGSLIRLWLHIADVDEIIKSGSALDEFAKERGQSLYLPLKPLHMLPGAAMDAASFSTSLPTEAITVMVDFDVNADLVRNWEVFPSIVPPVRKVNYNQFDVGMELGARASELTDDELGDLKWIAFVAPLLATKLDTRKSSRKMRTAQNDEIQGGSKTGIMNGNNSSKNVLEDKTIASVRLIKRWDRNRSKSLSHTARVVDFQTTGSHQTVNDILTCAGSLIRQFAKENRVFLPEDRDAFLHSGRCGTAPLRRYSDLAVQRQVKCILFGRQPAGKRRMDDLKIWLAKRQSAAERTISERRRTALFESFSNFCSQKCSITGQEKAMVRGIIRSVCVTKRFMVKVDVSLVGTGLSVTASVSGDALELINKEAYGDETFKGLKSVRSEVLLEAARRILRTNGRVRVEISEVDTVSYNIEASIVGILD